MSDNPFAEPDDDDRTVIIPRSTLAPVAAAAPASEARPVARTAERDGEAVAATAFPAGHGSPIVAEAVPLLVLLSGLRNLASVPDAGQLRASTVDAVRRYEQALRDAAIPIDLIRLSHYALCASLDDVVQNTPWGSHGPWADASLVSTFHGEVRSGDRFFEVLTRLRESPARFLPVIELMYLCMSLGMRGRYRLSPRGPAEHDRVREDTYLVILRQRGPAEKALSPRWRGAAAPYRAPGREVPVWLVALLGAGLVGALFAWARLDLSGTSDALFERALALPPTTMPVIARPSSLPAAPVAEPPGALDALTRFLEPEIRRGLLSIAGTQMVPVIRLESAGMFSSGSAEIRPPFTAVLARIAAALHGHGGKVRVVGYTDNRPVHTVAFPSNYQLSLARADAAAGILRHGLGADRRVSVEGRADADPIASNGTEAGRQQNRRVEIICEAY